jgi:hypothetical protein
MDIRSSSSLRRKNSKQDPLGFKVSEKAGERYNRTAIKPTLQYDHNNPCEWISIMDTPTLEVNKMEKKLT